MYRFDGRRDGNAFDTIGNNALAYDTWDEPVVIDGGACDTDDDAYDPGYMKEAVADIVWSLRSGSLSGDRIALSRSERLISLSLLVILTVLSVAYVLAVNIM